MILLENEKKDKNIFKRIISENWEAFKKKHPSYDNPQYEDVVQKALLCGTEQGGYTEYRCNDCGQGVKRIPFTCKSCFCLSCAKVYTDDVVSQVSKMLRPGMRYRHVVLTIPKQLREIFYRDRKNGKLLSAFMRTGYKCVEEVAGVVVKREVKIGMIMVLQTHGRSGHYNPHLHILMTSGGINENRKEWRELKYLPFEIIHTKWQYHLLKMMKEQVPTEDMKKMVDSLYKKYTKGFVANASKGEAPEKAKGLAKYLAKYMASPPISVRRIIKYDGKMVTYWYDDHETGTRKEETIDVLTFMGRMVQHILPKGFQRIRYYGLQATRTYKKWSQVIKEGIKNFSKTVKGVYEVVTSRNYRKRYMESSGKDPLECSFCGCGMKIWKIWHPKYGVIYDEEKNIRQGKYEEHSGERKDGGRCTVRGPTGVLQISMFPLPV
jgi:hypothetical protein